MPRAKLSNADRAKALRAEIRDNASRLTDGLNSMVVRERTIPPDGERSPEEVRALSFLARTLSPAQLKALDVLCYPRTTGLPGSTGQTHAEVL